MVKNMRIRTTAGEYTWAETFLVAACGTKGTQFGNWVFDGTFDTWEDGGAISLW